MSERLRSITYLVPPGVIHLGSLRDPATGEEVDVYATPVETSLPYRKSDGSFGQMRSAESDQAIPTGGLWELYTSNGRAFGENYFDRDGWWIYNDIRYLPLARSRGRVLRFLTELTDGLGNGFPWWDVVAYATRWSFRSRCRRTALETQETR